MSQEYNPSWNVMQLFRLDGKWAFVTGGARNLGFDMALALAEAGANVIVTSRSADSARESAQLISKYTGQKAIGMSLDVRNEQEIQDTVEKILAETGRIDILVNNAGVSESTPFADYTEAKFEKVMDLNVKGVFNCSKAASEHMVAAGSGVILNTSSMVSIYGQPAGIAYPTSKFAVNGFTLSLARELGPKGVRVNAVAPGITYTDMMRAVPKEVIEPMIAQVPLRRMGQPEDIANAFVFLASERASYITGEVLHVDGLARA